MDFRGTYEVKQTDRARDEADVIADAQKEIIRQLGEKAMEAFASSIRRENPSPKYPYGRFVIDVNIRLISVLEDPQAPEGVQTITE